MKKTNKNNPSAEPPPEAPLCSFCLGETSKTSKIIAGPFSAFICEYCVAVYSIILTGNFDLASNANANAAGAAAGAAVRFVAKGCRCSFCKRKADESGGSGESGYLRRIIAGLGLSFICEECVAVCVKLLKEETAIDNLQLTKQQRELLNLYRSLSAKGQKKVEKEIERLVKEKKKREGGGDK